MIELERVGADDPRLARFHAGIYMDAFAAQQEPLECHTRQAAFTPSPEESHG